MRGEKGRWVGERTEALLSPLFSAPDPIFDASLDGGMEWGDGKKEEKDGNGSSA